MTKHKELLEKQLYNNFLDKDLTIILDGSISTDFIIKKTKILISDKTIFITDGNKQELVIALDEVTDVVINTYIVLELETQKITLDY